MKFFFEVVYKKALITPYYKIIDQA